MCFKLLIKFAQKFAIANEVPIVASAFCQWLKSLVMLHAPVFWLLDFYCSDVKGQGLANLPYH